MLVFHYESPEAVRVIADGLTCLLKPGMEAVVYGVEIEVARFKNDLTGKYFLSLLVTTESDEHVIGLDSVSKTVVLTSQNIITL